jgi:hypothetical protein
MADGRVDLQRQVQLRRAWRVRSQADSPLRPKLDARSRAKRAQVSRLADFPEVTMIRESSRRVSTDRQSGGRIARDRKWVRP